MFILKNIFVYCPNHSIKQSVCRLENSFIIRCTLCAKTIQLTNHPIRYKCSIFSNNIYTICLQFYNGTSDITNSTTYKSFDLDTCDLEEVENYLLFS